MQSAAKRPEKSAHIFLIHLPGTTITLLNCTVEVPSPPDRVVTITSPLPGLA